MENPSFSIRKAQSTRTAKFDPRTLSRGNFPVLTGNFPVLTKMYTKVRSVNFHMSYFHMFVSWPFKIITRIILLFSNYLGRYSYSFRARQALISVYSSVGLTGIFLCSCSSVQLHKKWSSELFSKYYSYLQKNGFQNKDVMISKRMVP